ncbi:lactonase family protein [Jiulongibacter sediminis]|uniref:3-carboxymuconate cyclase n=1 Tax=Jiulongibacter sediminis TaxID=1605367 RepID=A0A0P7BNW1_9BACT|nr:lactonase family protein [Jiulongibacter sediminis]KPM48901.1 3-carboxymuconate cyclase [Jiulongibacter sediminis]TBX25430.1 3-carboxymuconate cyclase [Jiulongibacter sediminis]
MIKKLSLLLAVAALASCSNPTEKETETEEVENLQLYIGTYTSKGSQGIYKTEFNPEKGELMEAKPAAESDDPSFLALSPDGGHLYAVSEVNGGSIRSFSRGDSSLTFINESSSGGIHPCHVAIDKTGKWIFAGNYTSGSLAVLPILENGGVGEPVQVIQHQGSGPNKERQKSPHVHSVNVSPDNKAIFVPDLGMDKVMVYAFDETTGQLTPGDHMEVTPGSGPRHFTFHPNGKFAYVVQELTGSVTQFNYANGGLEKVEEFSTLPEGFEGDNSSADIHISPDGRFLYASNRFIDNIAVFAIDQESGSLSAVSHHSVLGQVPRNFAISPDGQFLLVANQESDNIIVFKRDKETGKLSPTGGEIKVSMPVCLIFTDK